MVFKSFSEKMQAIINQKGFIEPTLPQKMGIPEILKGTNVLIIAPTGIGKTETVMLPVLDMIHTKKNAPIAALYITPLRALNRDLLDRLFWWGDKLDIEIAVRHGDTSQKERASQREVPPHCLITTPETLQALLTGKKIREHLKNIRYVIVDEIHELVDSKRGIQLSLALERLHELSGPFQRIGLSATVGSPELVAQFLGENVKIIMAEAVKKYEIGVVYPRPTVKDRKIADDLLIGVETTARLRKLHELIKGHRSVLAFTNTRETAEVLSSRLRALDRELKQAIHHGSVSKETRIVHEKKFKQQELKSLIATSSLELGIDIGSIDLVVQYLSPRQVARLVQRVGRAGHKIGEVSKGIILSGEEDLFEAAVIAKRAMKKELETIKMHDMALDVLANQILGLALDEYEITDDKAFKIIKRATPYKNLARKEFTEILKFLESSYIIYLNEHEGKYKIKRRKRTFDYYFENLTMIPDKRSYKVISIIQHEPVGTLDEAFVAEHGKTGEKFVVAGRAWKVIQVENGKVMVEPVEDIESAIPAWEGELIPVPYEIAQEVGRLRRSLKDGKMPEKYAVDAAAEEEMISVIKKQAETHEVPDDKTFLIETYKDFIIIHSCCGSLVNDTIGRYLAAMLTRRTGVSVNIKSDPYRIILQTPAKVEIVKELLEKDADIDSALRSELEMSSQFKWRFLHVARRFGILSRKADFEKINMTKIVSTYASSPVYKETMRELFLEKMDVEKAGRVLEKIKTGEIKIKVQSGLSFLGEMGLTHQFKEVMKPRMPEKEIYLAFRKRLLATRMRFICMNCSDYSLIQTVRNISKEPECPKCGSHLIAAVSKYNQTALDIVKKKLKKKELTKEELREFQNIRRTADLIIVYGRKAVACLAGRGIGPETAARILSRLHTTNEKLFLDVLEAEKQFAKTKKYWK